MKNIIALVGAIVVGIILVKVIGVLIGFAITVLGLLLYGAIVAVVIYFLYRVFGGMLGSGRHLSD